MKSWLQDNDIEMYLTHKKGKSVVKKQNLQMHDFSIKNEYVDKSDDIITKHHTYHSIIKIKPLDVKSRRENNDKDPEFEICDYVRKSKYKNSFAKGYTPNWSDKVL